MKKLCLFGFGFLSLVLFFSCFSGPAAKPLDLATVSGDIPVSSISLLIGNDADENGKGKEFLHKFYTENIGTIKEMLKKRGVNINEDIFLNEYNSNPNIGLEEIKITSSFIAHRYYWNSQTQSDIQLEFLLNFVLLEDGTMPLTATIKKKDENYEPGYETEMVLNLKFE